MLVYFRGYLGMKSSYLTRFLTLCLVSVALAATAHAQTPKVVTQPAEIGQDAKTNWQVLCFLGTECPLAKLYGPRLQSLADQFAGKGVEFTGVFSNRQDSPAEIERYVAQHGITFPTIQDIGNKLADRWGATRTPEVLVIDGQERIRYQGRIDDQYEPGVMRLEPKHKLLEAALHALLQGNEPDERDTGAVGCIIGRVRKVDVAATDSIVTYAEHIAPILHKHCLECHRKGQIGPFAMDDFDEIVGWAEMMRETIDQERMPPWHAAPPHDRFLGSRIMDETEKSLVRRWVDQGMPAGNLDETPMPPPFVDGWALSRTPDMVLEMASQSMEIPAQGTVDYQYFVIDPGFESDQWVSESQVVPGNAAVVHHAICFVRPPDGSEFKGVGWLGAYVPGQRPAVLPPGHARLVPAGSKLVFQMHYTPTGKPETDTTRLGIVFTEREDVTHEVVTLLSMEQSFEIPVGAKHHAVTASLNRFPRHGRLLSITPHMHYRGSAFQLQTLIGEQRAELLSVPHYDFNWQHDYRLREPVELDDITRLEFTAWFDNSANNPWNPDPNQVVTWGEQTWEEMAVAFFDIAEPLEVVAEETQPSQSFVVAEVPASLQQRREDFVNQFFTRFDVDGDGKVRPGDVSQAFSAFGFWRFDNNSDRVLDRDELLEASRQHIRD